MDKKRKALAQTLKNVCRPAFEYLCNSAGLTDTDKHLLTLAYRDNLSEDFISDTLNMSKSAFQEKKRRLLDVLVSYYDFITMFSRSMPRG